MGEVNRNRYEKMTLVIITTTILITLFLTGCIRLRPCWQNHVWAYDFVMARTNEGKAFRMLTVIDEYTRECLAIEVARKFKANDVLYALSELFLKHGTPDHIRSDNGPEFTAEAVRKWLGRVGVTTLFIEPGSPWENGYNESFNGKLRDELLNGEIFMTMKEAKYLIEAWRQEYNTFRPHSSIGRKPPAPETFRPAVLPCWMKPPSSEASGTNIEGGTNK